MLLVMASAIALGIYLLSEILPRIDPDKDFTILAACLLGLGVRYAFRRAVEANHVGSSAELTTRMPKSLKEILYFLAKVLIVCVGLIVIVFFCAYLFKIYLDHNAGKFPSFLGFLLD